MQTYRRFVSYVYQYENGKKAGNRGFIKVEARGNTCSMQISLKGICRDGNGTCKIYGFKREEGLLKGSLLAECPVKMGIVQDQLVSLRNEMGDARYSLHDLSGVIFRGDDETMYGTQWDDAPMKMENFQPDEKNVRRKKAVAEPETVEDMGAEIPQGQPGPEAPAVPMGESPQETQAVDTDGAEMAAEQQILGAGIQEGIQEDIEGEIPAAEILQEEIQEQGIWQTEMQQTEMQQTEILQGEVQEQGMHQTEMQQTEILQGEIQEQGIQQIEIQQTEMQQAPSPQEEIQQMEGPRVEMQKAQISQEEVQQAQLPQEEIQEQEVRQTEMQQAQLLQEEVQQAEIPQGEIQQTGIEMKVQEEADGVLVQESDVVGTAIQESVGEMGGREERRMPPKDMEGPVSDGQGSGEISAERLRESGRAPEMGSGAGRGSYPQEEENGAGWPEQTGLPEMSGPAGRQQEMGESGNGAGQWAWPQEEGLPEVLDTTVPIPDTETMLHRDGDGDDMDERRDIGEEAIERERMDRDHMANEVMRDMVLEERVGDEGVGNVPEDHIGAEIEAENVEGTAAQREDRSCPFTDGVLEDCRKISIEDLRFLDPRDQGMRNNRFVQHGYQMFGHLLLAKVARNSQYILGVPGMYQKQEKFMADMFGFHNFKCARRKSNRQACFGYWYRLIYPPKLGRWNEKADRS